MANLLSRFAVGATPKLRFVEVTRPDRLRATAWLGQNEDQQFRAALGAVMLTYETGSIEYRQLEDELAMIRWGVAFVERGFTDGPPAPVRQVAGPAMNLLEVWVLRELRDPGPKRGTNE